MYDVLPACKPRYVTQNTLGNNGTHHYSEPSFTCLLSNDFTLKSVPQLKVTESSSTADLMRIKSADACRLIVCVATRTSQLHNFGLMKCTLKNLQETNKNCSFIQNDDLQPNRLNLNERKIDLTPKLI